MNDEVYEILMELCLVMLYLTSREEDYRKTPGQKIWRARLEYPYKILSELTDRKLISRHKKSKSVVLTDQGIRKAQDIINRYSW